MAYEIRLVGGPEDGSVHQTDAISMTIEVDTLSATHIYVYDDKQGVYVYTDWIIHGKRNIGNQGTSSGEEADDPTDAPE